MDSRLIVRFFQICLRKLNQHRILSTLTFNIINKCNIHVAELFSTNVPKSPIRELLELEPETAKFGSVRFYVEIQWYKIINFINLELYFNFIVGQKN